MKNFKLILLILCWLGVSFFSLKFGTVYFSNDELLAFIKQTNGTEYEIILLRFYRFLQASIAGGTLAFTGNIFQRILQNPIADPYTLGISSGGLFFLSLAIILNAPLMVGVIPTRTFICFLGCLLSYFILSAFIKRLRHATENMILVGLSLNIFFGSLFILTCSLATPMQSYEIFRWVMGSIQETTSFEILGQFALIGFVTPFIFRLQQQIDACAYGPEMAITSGFSIDKIRMVCVLLCSILISSCVSFCGLIGFVGLVVPHIAKVFFAQKGTKTEWAGTFLLGSLLLSTADVVSRLFHPLGEIPVGVIVSLLGAPWLIYTIYKMSKR